LLLGDDPDPVRDQVGEITPPEAEVIEYQQHRLTCIACGEVTSEASGVMADVFFCCGNSTRIRTVRNSCSILSLARGFGFVPRIRSIRLSI
jgi:hypothetical protein